MVLVRRTATMAACAFKRARRSVPCSFCFCLLLFSFWHVATPAFTPQQLAFAYVANKMQPGLLGDYRSHVTCHMMPHVTRHRSVELIETAYACVAAHNAPNVAASSKL